MKAVLVIDVDDCINVEPCKADVYVRFPFQSNGWVREYKNVSLKPMPEKDTYEPSYNHEYSKAEIMAYTYGLTVGRNLCLEEIENG